MTITHFGYNSFIVSSGGLTVAIDPGAELYHLRFKPTIPWEMWKSITHILVTHADPDHHWYTDRVVEQSGAVVICGERLTRLHNEKRFMLGPRNRGLAFTYCPPRLLTVQVGETVEVDGISVTGVAAAHGPLKFRLGPFRKALRPGPKERMGYGAIGYLIEFTDQTIVNLGDTVKILDRWTEIEQPNVLMIPIGGDTIGNTMGIDDAVDVVKLMRPRTVIPCHYNLPSVLKRNGNPTDVNRFSAALHSLGIECCILSRGESLVL